MRVAGLPTKRVVCVGRVGWGISAPCFLKSVFLWCTREHVVIRNMCFTFYNTDTSASPWLVHVRSMTAPLLASAGAAFTFLFFRLPLPLPPPPPPPPLPRSCLILAVLPSSSSSSTRLIASPATIGADDMPGRAEEDEEDEDKPLAPLAPPALPAPAAAQTLAILMFAPRSRSVSAVSYRSSRTATRAPCFHFSRLRRGHQEGEERLPTFQW